MLIPAAIAAGGAIIGGLMSRSGQNSANRTNLKIAREQMAFQERMANTAHQREIVDLKAAGLNPILSATGGHGAPSPAGASTTVQNENAGLGEAVASAGRIAGMEKARLAMEAAVASSSVEKAQQEVITGQALAKLHEANTVATLASAEMTKAKLPAVELEAEMWRRLAPYATRGMDFLEGKIRDLLTPGIPNLGTMKDDPLGKGWKSPSQQREDEIRKEDADRAAVKAERMRYRGYTQGGLGRGGSELYRGWNMGVYHDGSGDSRYGGVNAAKPVKWFERNTYIPGFYPNVPGNRYGRR